ncbi:MAG: hypothetical protein K8F91_25795, partial [Candidatus Obscuribacterales bacterium]|nr:hypothetical protein [Candidatus Obscuribacterales bacterium]
MAIVMELIDSPQAFARKKKTEVISGPHSLSRNSWAPAISPDFAGMIKKGYLCLADRYGRLSIVDLKKAGDPRHPPKVVAELTNLGKNVVSVSFDQIQAYVLISEEKDNLKKNSLTTINLTKPEEPHIVSTVPLTQLKEVRALSGDRKMSIVAGTSCSDQEVVLVLNGSSKASITEASLISTITTKLPVVAMLYQGRQLTILSTDGTDSRVDFIDLANKSAPRLIESIEQKGNFSQLSQNKNLIVIAGVTSEGNCEARSLSLKPAPHAIAGVKLDQLQFVLASAVQKDKYLLLGKSQDKLTLLSVSIDKHGNLIRSQEIDLGKNKAANFQTAQLVWDKKQLYVAAGWSGVKVLKSNRDSFSDQFTYAIPRLAASGIATWGKHAIVVGGELVRYDISEPQDPKIESRQALTSPIKSMVGAGSFLLCLTKGNLLLKKMSLLD